MELNPVTGFGVTAPTTIEVSSESLRSLVRQIEGELYCSEVYNIALKSLQKMLGQAASKAEIVIKAVGREAIQLALKQIAKQQSAVICTTEVVTPSETISVTAIPSNPSSVSSMNEQVKKPESSASKVQISVVSPLGFIAESQPENISAEDSEETSTLSDNSVNLKTKPLTQAEINHHFRQQQKVYLQEIGEELRKARESYHLTLQQMHYFTLVPLHHLEALEQGQLEYLPEDIYIRGFICRVANALGLEGGKLAASFPCLEFSAQLQQSTVKADVNSEFYLNSAHLYFGYVAILASSMGGIAWLSQQSVPDVTLPPDIQNLLEQKTPQSHRQGLSTPIPGRQSDPNKVEIGLDFSPPEMMDSAIALF